MRELPLLGLLLLVLGGLVYCLLVLWAGIRFRATRKRHASLFTPPVSLMKPLAGVELYLERNLETFFRQDYPDYELLFAVSDRSDPALAVVERLKRKYPHVPVSVHCVGASQYVNRK